MNEEMTKLWVPQTQHIRGNVWCGYSVPFNQVIMKTVKRLTSNGWIVFIALTFNATKSVFKQWPYTDNANQRAVYIAFTFILIIQMYYNHGYI